LIDWSGLPDELTTQDSQMDGRCLEVLSAAGNSLCGKLTGLATAALPM